MPKGTLQVRRPAGRAPQPAARRGQHQAHRADRGRSCCSSRCSLPTTSPSGYNPPLTNDANWLRAFYIRQDDKFDMWFRCSADRRSTEASAPGR